MDMSNRQPEQMAQDRWGHDLSGYIEINLEEALRILTRRKWQIMTTVVILTGLIVLVTLLLTPKYTAEAEIVFDAKPANLVDFQAVFSGQPQDEAALMSEIETLKSRNVAYKVVRDLELDMNPEFNASLREESKIVSFIKSSPLQYVLTLFKDVRTLFKKEETAEVPTEEQRREREVERVVDAFLERISVSQQGKSRVVAVGFESETPSLSSAGANAIVDVFLVERLEGRFDTVKRASNWLAGRVQELRETVEASETAVEQYRKRHGLLQGEQYTLVAEEISDLNARLTEARVLRSQAQANLSQARRLSSSAAGFGSAGQVLASNLIQQLGGQQAELERREAELSQQYGPRHPIMINIKAEQEKLRQRIEGEVGKIYASLRSELEVAQRREAAVSKDLQKIKDEMAVANSATIGLRMLEREAEANRVMLEKFTTSFMETSAQEQIETLMPVARVISPAITPEFKSSPKRTLIVAFGFIGSVLISLVLVFVLETLDRGFRSAEQIERSLRVPFLGSVPMVPGFLAKGGPSTFILKNPSSAFAESIRSIYVRMMLSSSDVPPRTVMVVSSEPEEGKSALALSLAQSRQNAGQKVVIVDADFRRSVIARNLGLPEQPGLMDFLAGNTDIKGVLQIAPQSGLHVIPAGNYVATGSDLLVSEKMKLLLQRLRENYDLVILDSAPILMLSDPQVLSRMADATILVVRWGKTARKVVNHNVNMLTDAGGRIAGIALSMVNPKKNAGYGYGESSHYYGKAKKYYVG